MAIAKKVTSGNHLPGTGDNRFPVYSKQFNALVDVVLEIEATDDVLTPTTVTASGAITSSGDTEGVGYSTGAGGAVTQITSATTAVTSNTVCGTITTVALTNTAGVDHEFTLTNSAIAATDVVVVSVKSYGGTSDGIPVVNVTATAAGSCVINLRNTGAVALDALAVLNFAVIKGVAA
jgi:hypothetical protein